MSSERLLTKSDLAVPKKIRAAQRRLLSWFERHGRDFPWRRSNISNYEKIIAEILPQRTRAETVSSFFPLFIRKYPSWRQLSLATKRHLEKFLKPIGLSRQKAHALRRLSKAITLSGRIPKVRKDIEALPGVGQYTANAIELMVFNRPSP